MDLHWAVEDMYALKISMVEVSFAGNYLKGNVERYADNRARVLVRSSLSEAEKRATTVKELCHIIIDEAEDWSASGTETIQSLIDDDTLFRTDGLGDANPSPELVSEGLALLASCELMYPGEYQDADLARLEAQETTISAIALQHKVPPYVIQQAFKFKHLRDRSFAEIAEAMQPQPVG